MQSDVRVGDLLVTSGLGERFPAGFPVAEVTGVERPAGAAFMIVEAAPLASLDRGREVLLVVETRSAAPAVSPSESDELAVPDSGPAPETGSDGGTATESIDGPATTGENGP